MPQTKVCFFVSDLHGSVQRYRTLFDRIKAEKPDAVFIGGDILPSPFAVGKGIQVPYHRFIEAFLFPGFQSLKKSMNRFYPRIFIILGNDDSRYEESAMLKGEAEHLWQYCHFRSIRWGDFFVTGYTFVPPTPFRLKDWERYDVTRFVRPGCIPPEDGMSTVDIPSLEFDRTIEGDLNELSANTDPSRTIYLFHSPPHRTRLDRAGLDGHRIDGIQVDVHVGSVAIQRFIARYQPPVTLHGHIHESARLTGSWRETFGCTHSFNGSHDGGELALIRFNPYDPGQSERVLL